MDIISNNIGYADDAVLMTDTRKQTERNLKQGNRRSKKRKGLLNVKQNP